VNTLLTWPRLSPPLVTIRHILVTQSIQFQPVHKAGEGGGGSSTLLPPPKRVSRLTTEERETYILLARFVQANGMVTRREVTLNDRLTDILYTSSLWSVRTGRHYNWGRRVDVYYIKSLPHFASYSPFKSLLRLH
jgi:hypothetical protein